jgi:hypothetical protein
MHVLGHVVDRTTLTDVELLASRCASGSGKMTEELVMQGSLVMGMSDCRMTRFSACAARL